MLELIDFPLKQTQTASGALKIIHSRVNAATSQPKGCWFESWPDPISVSSHVLRGFLPPSTGMRVRLMSESDEVRGVCHSVLPCDGWNSSSTAFICIHRRNWIYEVFLYRLIKNHGAIFLL